MATIACETSDVETGAIRVLLIAADPHHALEIEHALDSDREENGADVDHRIRSGGNGDSRGGNPGGGDAFEIQVRHSVAEACEPQTADSCEIVLYVSANGEPWSDAIEPLKQAFRQLPIIVVDDSVNSVGTVSETLFGQSKCVAAVLPFDEIRDGRLTRKIRIVVDRFRLESKQREVLRAHIETEQRLKGQIRRLLAARDASNRMIDALAHESRTPLAVVQEYCSLVSDGLAGPVTDEQRRYLANAMNRVGEFGRLLNDFVDASWLESGTRRVRPQPVRLVEIADRLEPVLRASATAEHVRMEFRVYRDLPDVYCDADIVGRAIASIAGHAIRSAEDDGVVCISAEAIADRRQVMVRVAIRPAGSGANKHAAARSAAAALPEGSANFPSASFGIAASKTLIRASLSELRMQTNADGAEYCFLLPEAGPEAVLNAYVHSRKTGDGSLAAVALVTVSLDQEAGNTASDALDEILFNTVDSGDLVFRMERCVWLLIVDATRQEPQATADRLQDAWQQAYCGRPKKPPAILVEIKAHYHIPSEEGEPPMSTDEHTFAVASREPAKPCILLVDDDHSIVEALRIRLSLSGYDVLTAHDGMQGLTLAESRRPGIILLDIRMPVMDGLTMLARMRESETTRQIPVVVLSASHDDRRRALELGAYFFLEKPYDPNVLKIMIASILRTPEAGKPQTAGRTVSARRSGSAGAAVN